MKHEILFLGSQSQSRYALLQEAGIPFRVIPHRSTELETEFSGDLEDYVKSIARHKMESLELPDPLVLGLDRIIVLTADSMVQDPESKELLGKPKDKIDAARMLGLARSREMLIVTGCCIHEYRLNGLTWQLTRDRVLASKTIINFVVQPDDLEYYFDHLPEAMYSAGAGILENFGGNYLKSVQGSFTGGRGLPLFEVRSVLREFEFKFV